MESRVSRIVPSQTPPTHTVPHRSDVGCPALVTLRQKKMAQMKEHIKDPEKIQLSNEEIVSLSDVQFKTLVIRMLTVFG